MSVARGEDEYRQAVLVPLEGIDLRDVSLSISDLELTSDPCVTLSKVTLGTIGYVNTGCYRYSSPIFVDIPDVFLETDGFYVHGALQPVYVMVTADPSSQVGTYEGTLTIDRNNKPSVDVDVAVTVLDFNIPYGSPLKCHFSCIQNGRQDRILREQRLSCGYWRPPFVDLDNITDEEWDLAEESVCRFFDTQGNAFMIIRNPVQKGANGNLLGGNPHYNYVSSYTSTEINQMKAFWDGMADILADNGYLDRAAVWVWDEPKANWASSVATACGWVHAADSRIQTLITDNNPGTYRSCRNNGTINIHIIVQYKYDHTNDGPSNRGGQEVWLYQAGVSGFEPEDAPHFLCSAPPVANRVQMWLLHHVESPGTFYWETEKMKNTPGAYVSLTPHTDITVMASSMRGDNQDWDHVIDGSGMHNGTSAATEGPYHGNLTGGYGWSMWHTAETTSPVTNNPAGVSGSYCWIKFDFGRVTPLGELEIWNYNRTLSGDFTGDGIKDALIHYSTKASPGASDYTELTGGGGDDAWSTDHWEFNEASGAMNYAGNTTIDFDGVCARYVVISGLNNHGTRDYYGLSEVRFRNPDGCLHVHRGDMPAAGDGTLLHRSPVNSYCPSLRLRHLADGMEDVYCMQLLEELLDLTDYTKNPRALNTQAWIDARSAANSVLSDVATACGGNDFENYQKHMSNILPIREDLDDAIIELQGLLDTVCAWASSDRGTNNAPSHAFDGAGLHGDYLEYHDNFSTLGNQTMWHSAEYGGGSSANNPAGIAGPAWIAFDLFRPEPLDSIDIWNYNRNIDSVDDTDQGVNHVRMHYKYDDSDSWHELSNGHGSLWDPNEDTWLIAQATGAVNYQANTSIDLDGIEARYFLMTAEDNHCADDYYGLSEVCFYRYDYNNSNYINTWASSERNSSNAAIHVIDGTGLYGSDHQYHDNLTYNPVWSMWHSAEYGGGSSANNPVGITGPCWIALDLGTAYALGELDIWNFNRMLTSDSTDEGIKDARIHYRLSASDTWTELTGSVGTTHWDNSASNWVFTQATGASDYTANTTIDFDNALARYVVITGLSNHCSDSQDPSYNYYGLSEVRFNGTLICWDDAGWDYDISHVIVKTSGDRDASNERANIINGAGMHDGSQDDYMGPYHKNDNGQFWHSAESTANAINNPAGTDGPVWVQIDLGEVQALDELSIWNYNLDGSTGDGIKNACIHYRAREGDAWQELTGTSSPWSITDDCWVFAQGSGLDTYQANTTIDFNGITARYVLITGLTNHSSGTRDYYGLSEVRFSTRLPQH